jgi:H+-translocating NAD(P) transhydrogenase subunit alpha
MKTNIIVTLIAILTLGFVLYVWAQPSVLPDAVHPVTAVTESESDYWQLFFVFVLATFIGVGVIARVSRLLHTPLMSITNAISAIAVMGSIIVTGTDYSHVVGPELAMNVRILGAIALFASMTNIVSGFLITQRMLKMFKEERKTDAVGEVKS